MRSDVKVTVRAANAHPLVVSPNWWMWKPCRPGLSPSSLPLSVTAPSASVMMMVPDTPSVPLRTHTADMALDGKIY